MEYTKEATKTIVDMCVEYIFDRITIDTFIANLRMYADCLEENLLAEEQKQGG